MKMQLINKKSIEDRVEEQILNTDQKSITDLFLKGFSGAEARDELNKIKEIEQKINKDDLICKTDNKKQDKTYDSKKFETIRPFGKEIHSGILTLNDTLEEQITHHTTHRKRRRTLTFQIQTDFLKQDKKLLMALKTKHFL